MAASPSTLHTSRVPRSICPWCDTPLDAATSANLAEPEVTPSPGDWTFCIECTSLLIFTEGLGVRKATPAEERASFDDPVCRRARHALQRRT